jgi:hypothetical protein
LSRASPLRENRPVLQCEECKAKTDSFELGWSVFNVEDPDEGGAPELVSYCADCLAREFGGLLRSLTSAGRAANQP